MLKAIAHFIEYADFWLRTVYLKTANWRQIHLYKAVRLLYIKQCVSPK